MTPEERRARQTESQRRYSERNPEKVRANSVKWTKNNPEKAKAFIKNWRERHKDEERERVRKWRSENRDAARAMQRAWFKKNPEKRSLWEARRRKSGITPAWANTFFMEEVYALARLRTRMFGFPWHVDHIVPLISDLVCGLHCEQNMQVIPGEVNCKKSNNYWPDMPAQGNEHG